MNRLQRFAFIFLFAIWPASFATAQGSLPPKDDFDLFLLVGQSNMAGRGRVTGLIPCAVGGTGIDVWKPGERDSATQTHPWDDAMVRAKAAMKDGTLRGILWHQGESDSNPEKAAAYEAKLHDLIARFRDDLGAPDVPFIAWQLGRFEAKPWDDAKHVVDKAHQDLTSKVAATAYVSAEGLVDGGDKTHFDTDSMREFGRRYAAVYQNLITQ